MSMSTAAILFLRRLPRLRSSLPLTNLTSSFYRLLSTAATTQSPPPNPHFVAVDYLIQSYGLPSDGALQASKVIQHLKSPDKPDAVLRFLRQIGISDLDIRTAVSREPRFLVSHVEKNWRPNVVKLQEIGLSIEDISGIISHSPNLFRSNILPKIDFWMRVLGSFENMYVLLKRGPSLVCSNIEKVIVPNVLFLQQQCSLSVRQIVRLIKSSPRLITTGHESLVSKVRRADELGVPRISGNFVNALKVVSSLKESTIDARLLYWKSLGFSSEELNSIICKTPQVLGHSENLIGCKMEFLINEAACDKLHVVQNPALLTYSLEKRLRPRILVRKLLESKGFPVKALSSSVELNEVRFVEKFVLPYEHAIPGLHQAYKDACSGNVSGLKCLQKTS